MNKISYKVLCAVIAVIVLLAPSLGSIPTVLAAGICALTAGQVVINEVLPAPSDTVEWVELYNTTSTDLDLSNCTIDDIAAGGGSPVQIAAGELIPAHAFWTMNRTAYFNNGGDDVRLLSNDATTVLDSYTFGATTTGYSWYRNPDGQAWSTTATASPTKGATNGGSTGTCGTGTWTPNTLEIHHINVGQGDSTLIVSPTGKSLLFDVGSALVGSYVETVLGCKQLDYIAISHFHDDHVGSVGSGGLWNLVEVQGFTVTKTLVRDYTNYIGEKDLTTWKNYLEGPGQAKLLPENAVEGSSQVNLGGGVIIHILTVNGNEVIKQGDFHLESDAPSENDYSLGFLLTFNNFNEWLGGDLDGELSGNYHDIELSASAEIGDVDVYRVHHHGSSHSSNAVFVSQLDPEVSIISVGNNNTHSHPTQPVMDRLLATSTVYLTERGNLNTEIGVAIVAGHIVIRTTDGLAYTVNGTPYTTDTPNRADADGDGYFAGIDPDDNDDTRIPSLNGGCDPKYQVCTCQVTPGQVVINEILPAPSTGNPEWVELYNTTSQTLNLEYCALDDIAAGGGAPYQIPTGTLIAPHGFWAEKDFTSYFNNPGDSVRFLAGDQITVLDSYTFGTTPTNASWHRTPDGGPWAATPSISPTRGVPNNPLHTSKFRSQASYDGWILESTEASNAGGTMNTTAAALRLGDNNVKKQYRSILSFSTGASLPDTAVITKVMLKLKYSSILPVGTDPITSLQGMIADIRNGFFGTSAKLQLSDFNAPVSKTIGPFKPVLTAGWYTINLNSTTFASINKLAANGGLTQIRLRFKLDDNNNAVDNILNIISGNHATAAARPTLVIVYYLP